jgi:hypothetical protein
MRSGRQPIESYYEYRPKALCKLSAPMPCLALPVASARLRIVRGTNAGVWNIARATDTYGTREGVARHYSRVPDDELIAAYILKFACS